MPSPTPLTPTDELLAELVGEVRGLGDLLRDRLPEPPAPQDRTGTVELREPAATAPAPGRPATEPTTPPVAPPPAKRAPARKPPARRGQPGGH